MAAASSDGSLSRLHPEQARALGAMRDQALRTDPELIELCFARVLEILGERPESDLGTDDERQRAFLDFTEQFAFSVASVTDADVEALLRHAEPVEVYEFIAALYSLEMSTRIEIASRAVLADDRGGPQ